jgi:hypothetical protein
MVVDLGLLFRRTHVCVCVGGGGSVSVHIIETQERVAALSVIYVRRVRVYPFFIV